eukprot:TRINITY_DN102029_c0_g1_i1.p1 TRINITY_DN102029_c0_g1~~TRINITY_DN102029_c0_g1_i1.p1  ORF type:complete len:559 (-),score=74.99 TRINITY_DN102029_c0_g1_i1:216-1892(-)
MASFLLHISLSIFTVGTSAKSKHVAGTVDLAAVGSPFEHYWKRCVGSGHMLLGTREDWRTHLKLAVNELGIRGIRGHGLLDDDMSVLPRRGGEYEFYNIDQVFDYLKQLNIKPVVELSFMPSALVSCGRSRQPHCQYAFDDHGSYKGLTMPPDNFEDWYHLIKSLAEHLVARYGIGEVSSWHFEVWNEMWGMKFPEPYLALYNASAHALKSIHESLKVGGPATMQTLDVGDFIKAVRNKIPIDFISTHFYPTDPQCQTQATREDADCFAHTVLAARRLAKDAGLPFFITEYNNGLGGTSRDDSSAAAFVFRQIGLLDELDMFSWWTFSDVFEEGWMQSAPFHNGYGMMTLQGIRKPVWRAFEMLAGAGDLRLPVAGGVSPADSDSSISVLATKKILGNHTNVQLFISNYPRAGEPTRYKCDESSGQCKDDHLGTFTDEALCNADCKSEAFSERMNQDWLNVTLILRHNELLLLPATVNGHRIDDEHANPLATWHELGSPKYPTSTQIESMSAASSTSPAERIEVNHLNTTVSTISFHMPPNAVLHISFELRRAESVVV